MDKPIDPTEQSLRVPILRYLRYLRVERNFSDYTVKSYGEDLEAWLEYEKAVHHGTCPRPDHVDAPELRGYVLAMSEAEYARTTISRPFAYFINSENAKGGRSPIRRARSSIREREDRCPSSYRRARFKSSSRRPRQTIL